ncbi:MAG: hypothetical protein FWF05_08575 [Oscillospiraceae bacterium]|nr:hypothetical protein [Oscillospiraceae bacterium]
MKKLYICTIILIALVIFFLAGCAKNDEANPAVYVTKISIAAETTSAPDPSSSVGETIPVLPLPLAPKYEIELVAKTLRGECYDDQPGDKREVANTTPQQET